MCLIFFTTVFQILRNQKNPFPSFTDSHSELSFLNPSPNPELNLDRHHKTLKHLLTKGSNSNDSPRLAGNRVATPEYEMKPAMSVNPENDQSDIDINQTFSETVRRDVENEMDEYLVKFGGLSSLNSSKPTTPQNTLCVDSPREETPNRMSELFPLVDDSQRDITHSHNSELSPRHLHTHSSDLTGTDDQGTEGDDEDEISVDVES